MNEICKFLKTTSYLTVTFANIGGKNNFCGTLYNVKIEDSKMVVSH